MAHDSLTVTKKGYVGAVAAMSACIALTLGCASPQVQEEPPSRYEASFSYDVETPASEPLGISIGLIDPQFPQDKFEGLDMSSGEDVFNRMLRSLKTEFRQTLTEKGFTVAGPYSSIERMTFPQKQESSFVMLPVIEIEGGARIVDVYTEEVGNLFTSEIRYTCTRYLDFTFSVELQVREPITDQLMWTHNIESRLESARREVVGYDECSGTVEPVLIFNDRAQLNEQVFAQIMTELDQYISPDEFRRLNEQAQQLRDNARF